MFLNFYQLREQPFGVTPDPRFLYLGKCHREALASLFYAIEAERGFAALIAEPGLGKTTLTFQLLEKFARASRTVFLFQTQCTSRELLQYILNDLGVDSTGMDLVTAHNKLKEILSREMLAGRRFVLAIDEAQNLDVEVLETIRLMSNFETSRAKLLQILLVGQPELARKLASHSLEQLKQRISAFARLEPFGDEETALYIDHRLRTAGYTGDQLFSPAAIRLLADRSHGIPRNINALCFSALSLGLAMGRKQVDAVMMEEVIADRDVESLQTEPPPPRPMVAPRAPSPVLSPYRPKPRFNPGEWALGFAGVAVSIIITFAVLTYSPGRIGRLWQATTEAWTSIRNTSTFAKGTAERTPDSPTSPSAIKKNDLEAPNPSVAEPAAPSRDSEESTAVVQRGETLRQILRRTFGQDSGTIIEQVRKLNPEIADLNHVEVGQHIRLPRVSLPTVSEATSAEATIAGRN